MVKCSQEASAHQEKSRNGTHILREPMSVCFTKRPWSYRKKVRHDDLQDLSFVWETHGKQKKQYPLPSHEVMKIHAFDTVAGK